MAEVKSDSINFIGGGVPTNIILFTYDGILTKVITFMTDEDNPDRFASIIILLTLIDP